MTSTADAVCVRNVYRQMLFVVHIYDNMVSSGSGHEEVQGGEGGCFETHQAEWSFVIGPHADATSQARDDNSRILQDEFVINGIS